MLDFARARRNMVDNQLRTFDVTDRAILAAMADVPRERFVPPARAGLAYLDQNVNLSGPGEEPRWALQPMVLARMLQALEIDAGARALDVATGYGYAAQVLSVLGADVVALDSSPTLTEEAARRLEASSPPVTVRTGELKEGCAGDGPFDMILLNGAVETRPDGLLRQLKDGGRLACLLREGAAGHAVLFVRAGDGFGSRRLFDAAAPVLPGFAAERVFEF